MVLGKEVRGAGMVRRRKETDKEISEENKQKNNWITDKRITDKYHS